MHKFPQLHERALYVCMVNACTRFLFLAQLLRLVDNDAVEPDDAELIKDDIDMYIEGFRNPEYVVGKSCLIASVSNFLFAVSAGSLQR